MKEVDGMEGVKGRLKKWERWLGFYKVKGDGLGGKKVGRRR